MLSLKNKKNLLLTSIVLLLCITILGLFFYQKHFSTVYIHVSYNQKFPDNIYYNLIEQKKVKMNADQDYNVIFYLSQSCSVCINNLPEYRNIMENYQFKKSYKFIWQDGIPIDYLKKFQIPLELNYYLKNKYSLSKVYPHYFIVDNQFNVVFSTQDIQSLKNKLQSYDNLKSI